MSSMSIGEVVARQFDRLWTTLRDAVSKLNDRQWRQGDCDWLAPVRLTYHVVETADFYCGSNSSEFQWGSLGGDWEGSPTTELPSQQQVLELLDRVQPKVRQWLMDTSDVTFLTAANDFRWTGGTHLDRALYLLRHSQHHLGQINAELRRRNLPPGKWG